MTALRQHFRPEFINRLDEIVLFRRLDRADLRKIVDIQLERVAERLKRRDVELVVSDPAREFLADVGWDPEFGARPLKRAVQKHLEDGLARQVLTGEFTPGDTIVIDRASDSELSFSHGPRREGNGQARAPTNGAANAAN
jgi:ATP-dependent Clp protease ATP-binding subunit ClpB